MYSEGTGQNIFLHSESSLKTRVGEDNWQIKDQNPDFMMDEIVWSRVIVSGGFDTPKNPGCKLTLQIWLEFEYVMVQLLRL